MKAMILAAGRGQRMMPLTESTPKPMLQVNGQPLLTYHINRLKLAGISDIVINLAWCGEVIEQYYGDGSEFGVKVTYCYEPAGGLETAGGIVNALPLLTESEDAFIVVNGDVFTDYDVAALTQLQLYAGEAHIVLVENPEHNLDGDFCLANQIVNTQKYTFSGIGLYTRDFFSSLSVGVLPLGPLLRRSIETGRVSMELYLGLWSDIGTPQRLMEINKNQEQNSVG
ncbi:N-acetylmuramate alpha-1-phosphate uridylyltransferase MurU [Pseudoalteromonas sp. MMG012]|uniref:N-acetylmuramate alpha-1-phosphate uridylyltransferase MurU n=1 Tax=Pseudoalteromonas sp. MMG012 TaxID=2822686 RepID=UPI001B3A0626|nr:nucleotidyltransferase family protein [Pseudoalteromonas sp. MMG012]MBQ4849141.1 nucleotidyltransferase family protein [Pseudoalteromonas sp. MMG012]